MITPTSIDAHTLMNERVMALIMNVFMSDHRGGTYVTFVGNTYSKLEMDGSPTPFASTNDARPKNITGRFFNRDFGKALDKLLEDPGVVALAFLSHDAVEHLKSTGTFETLNGSPIYVRDNRYWDLFP